MKYFKCTYWANGLLYSSSCEANTLDGATVQWTSIPGFQKFEDSPYQVNY